MNFSQVIIYMYNPLEVSTLITADFIPKDEIKLLTINNYEMLNAGNITGIVAGIGVGKSQICEYITATCLRHITHKPSISKLQCYLNQQPILYIDTERAGNSIYKGVQRVLSISECTHEEFNTYCQFRSLHKVTNYADKLEAIEYHLSHDNLEYQLVIIDGILDLLRNANDIILADELCEKLISLSVRYKCGIVYTVHGNRGDKSGKAKGHLGDSFQRKSQTMFYLEKPSKNERTLTTEFDHGKTRDHGGELTLHFVFNDTHLVETYEKVETKEEKKYNYVVQQLKEIYADQSQSFTYSELSNKIMKKCNKKKRTAEYLIKYCIEENLISLKDSKYFLLL